MGNDIILCMALIASFAFVIQFLLSILGSDLDTDIDIDNASDLSMSLSDIMSFKGITHCPERGCCIRIRATGYQSSIRKESRRRES